MTRVVLSLSVDTPIDDAARLLVGRGIAGAPVLGRDGMPMGVVSLVDLADPDRKGGSVGDRVHRPAITIAPEAEVEVAAERMLESDVHRLPVLDAEQRMVGIVTATDLLRALVREVS